MEENGWEGKKSFYFFYLGSLDSEEKIKRELNLNLSRKFAQNRGQMEKK